MLIDGNARYGTRYIEGDATSGSNKIFYAETLSAGTHTVELRYRGPSSRTYTASAIDQDLSFTIVKLTDGSIPLLQVI